MIFVTLGSQKFQFNRLLKAIDSQISLGAIIDNVFAQIGYSDYNPKNYESKKFLDRDEFQNKISECSLVITHSGTGAIISSLKANKKVIACPRLKMYGEHVDDHQVQIASEFSDLGLIEMCQNFDELPKYIDLAIHKSYATYQSHNSDYLANLEEYLNRL